MFYFAELPNLTNKALFLLMCEGGVVLESVKLKNSAVNI
jgi:hypothetical protein